MADQIQQTGFDTSGSGTGSGSFLDNAFEIKNSSDQTKKIVFDASAITTATTRTFVLPNVNTTLVGKTGTMASTYIAFWNDASQLTGSGKLLWDGEQLLVRSTTAGGLRGAQFDNSDATGQTNIYLLNDLAPYASYGGLLCGGSTQPDALFGVTRANKVMLFADGSSNLGLWIGTHLNKPVVFNVSDAEVARFTTAGLIGSGSASATFNSVILGSAANTISLGATSGAASLIESTSHATKGFTSIGSSTTFTVDEVNKRIGIGTATPTYPVHLQKSSTGTLYFINENTSNGNGATASIGAINNGGKLALLSIVSNTTSGALLTDVASRAALTCNGGGGLLIETDNSRIIFAVGGTATANEIFTATTVGVGIGVTTVTALLHFKAGTATASTAPIKLTNQSTALLGTPEVGAFEFGTAAGVNVLSFTRSGTTREFVLTGLSGASAPSTNSIGAILDYYGTSATRVLTTPATWISVVDDTGTTRKVPGY